MTVVEVLVSKDFMRKSRVASDTYLVGNTWSSVSLMSLATRSWLYRCRVLWFEGGSGLLSLPLFLPVAVTPEAA
jgi:hypothetical protein